MWYSMKKDNGLSMQLESVGVGVGYRPLRVKTATGNY